MALTPINGDLLAGIAGQRSETINASPNSLITGEVPKTVTAELVGASKNLSGLSVVGRDSSGGLVLATYGVANGTAATGTLTLSGVMTAGDTVTIGGIVYTAQATADADYEFSIGGSATLTAANLVNEINGLGFAPANPLVTASNASGTITLTARRRGVAGNLITTTEVGSNASFGAATLTGGVDDAYTGIRPIGILMHAVTTLVGDTTTRASVYRDGGFNPDLLVWDESFDTIAKKMAAFEGVPNHTNIVLRAPQAMTL